MGIALRAAIIGMPTPVADIRILKANAELNCVTAASVVSYAAAGNAPIVPVNFIDDDNSRLRIFAKFCF